MTRAPAIEIRFELNYADIVYNCIRDTWDGFIF